MNATATDAQKSALLTQGGRAFSKHSAPTDLLGMAANMGFVIVSLDDLTRRQATLMLNRLDEINESSPQKARFKRR